MLCFIGITYPAFTEALSLYTYKSTGTNDEMLFLSCLNAILAEAINALQEINCLEMSLSIENIFFSFFGTQFPKIHQQKCWQLKTVTIERAPFQFLSSQHYQAQYYVAYYIKVSTSILAPFSMLNRVHEFVWINVRKSGSL